MSPIVLIAGPSAVGKTTLSQGLARRYAESLHIPVDAMREMVVAGKLLPGHDWPAPLVRQLELARHAAIDVALRYRAAGFTVIIDDFWDPRSPLTEYAALRALPQVLSLILVPGTDTARAHLLRRDPPGPMRDGMHFGIGVVHEELARRRAELEAQGWHLIESTNDTPEMTVERVLSILAAAGAPQAL